MISSSSAGYQALAVTVVASLMALAIVGGIISYNPGAADNPLGVGLFPATVSLGATVGSHLASPFYAVVFSGTQSAPKAQANFGVFFNSTPITMMRVGGAGDGYDATTQTNWVAPSIGTHYIGVVGVMANFTWFKSWCYAQTPHCDWLWFLPAEENNTQSAIHTANYFHKVLKFAPTAWEFGNEPGAWTHYGKNETTWATTDAVTPTGPDYATMVKNYIKAISPLYPGDRYIGVENSCACIPSLVSNLTKMDGKSISAVAFHEYPYTTNSSTSLSQFMGSLASRMSIPNATAHMLQLDTLTCASCSNIPIQIGEYQAGGPVPTHSPYAKLYAGAPFLAASVIQALEANVSTFTVFESSWLINATSNQILPEGLLYQRVLANMTMGTDVALNVTVKGVGGVYALLIKNGTRDSLLLVNTNATKGIHLLLTTAVFGVGSTGSMWSWGPLAAYPSASRSVLLPTAYNVPAQGILLLDNY